MAFISILARSVFSFVLLLILSKITGKRQISQLTFYDYTTAVTIGSIAAALAVEEDVDVLFAAVAMAIYAFLTIFVGFLTDKSIVARRGTARISKERHPAGRKPFSLISPLEKFARVC